MNREIKFRVWHSEFGEMVYASSNSEWLFEKREFMPFVFEVGFSHYPKEEWTLMQWTGFNDKVGTPIFDGDIVDDEEFERRKAVEFISFLRNESNAEIRRMKVIGNIHQNPDLLK